MKKITPDFVCDKCGKPATLNLQNNWQLYEIQPSGNFKEIDTWEGSENSFFCATCYEKEMKN